MLRVAVDFGTSSTCTAVSVDGRAPQVVVVDGAPLVPSAVYVTADGTLFVGHEADRQAAVDPSRYEPHPKRRIDEPELLLGDTVLPVIGVIRAVLRRALQEARHLAGGAQADQLVLTHPADWGATRTQKLRRSAHGLATDVVLIPEPVAAAVFHAQGHAVPDGGCLAVLDLGGGTVDASVVRRATVPMVGLASSSSGPMVGLASSSSDFRVLATRGDPNFGGADVDQALLEHVGTQVAGTDPEAWRRLVEGRELADRRRRRVLRQDVRGAKETLSRHTYTDVPMPPPFPDAHVTRDDLERLISAPLHRTVALLKDTVADAGLRPEQLVGVFLVGGSSRIPMVSRLLHERLGVVPVTLDQPETVVARGALHAVLAGPAHRTAMPPQFVPGTGVPTLGAPSQLGLPPPAPAQPGHVPSGPTPAGLTPGAHLPPTPAGQGPPAAGAAPPGVHRTVPGATAPAFFTPGTPGAPVVPARRPRTAWIIAGAVLAATATAVALAIALTRDEQPGAQEIADHHYRFSVPDGWQRSGAVPADRQVNLGPVDRAVKPDQIFVKETELGYDAGADRDRAVDELRDDYESERATTNPPAFDGFDPSATFAGRDVLYYSQAVTGATVDWYVLFGGHYQVSVGCRHDEAGAERVRVACERVVRTLSVETRE